MKRITVLIAAAGTGGHVYPGLAVAAELTQAGHRVRWLGTALGIESQLAPQYGIPLYTVPLAGVRGKGLVGWLQLPWKLLYALCKALQIIRRVKPQVVLGMGGYGSVAGGLAARLLRVPLLIHEQNAIPGLANRVLKPLACQVLVGFAEVFGVRAQHVGNPVRAQFAAITAPAVRLAQRKQEELRILVIGGSQGAVALNQIVPQAVLQLSSGVRGLVYHQSGRASLAETCNRYRQYSDAKVAPFIDDMAAAYAWSDIVVCRSGAMTLAEICAAGAAAILVPLPHAVDDHQTHNAAYLSRHGAAVVLPQQHLNATSLVNVLHELALDRHKLLQLASAARRLARLDASMQVMQHCLIAGSGDA